jgi:hypothetical protein
VAAVLLVLLTGCSAGGSGAEEWFLTYRLQAYGVPVLVEGTALPATTALAEALLIDRTYEPFRGSDASSTLWNRHTFADGMVVSYVPYHDGGSPQVSWRDVFDGVATVDAAQVMLTGVTEPAAAEPVRITVRFALQPAQAIFDRLSAVPPERFGRHRTAETFAAELEVSGTHAGQPYVLRYAQQLQGTRTDLRSGENWLE